MDFAALSEALDGIKSAKTHQEKLTLTKTFMRNLRQEPQTRIFTIMRLILPKFDFERKAYRIKESKISKLLIKMLDLPQGSSDRNVLSKSFVSAGADFTEVVFSILKKYIVNQKTCLGLEQVNEYLDRIANRTSDNGLDDLMLEIFRKLSPKATRWFIQILLKDLKLGMGDNSILNCYHEDGADYYSNNSNLKKLCETFYDPQIKLQELEVNLFSPFRPMLSKRCDGKNFKKSFPESTKAFVVENKFDGERFQLHYNKNQIKLFSRNGYDFTDNLTDNFIKYLSDFFGSGIENLILDGELMLFNTQTQKFGSKGMNLDVKKLTRGKYKPCYCVFDILLLNDKILTSEPLYKRLDIMKKVVKNPVPGSLILSEYKKAHTLEDIVSSLNLSVDNNEEGIIVKDPKSVYKCGDRNSGWFKIKMEYFDDVVHDLDVLVMGGFYSNTKKITSFMVGVSSGHDTYLSLGRISSGLNDEQLEMLDDKLNNLGQKFERFVTESLGKLQFGRETPDIYIEPENSCVLQIRATELIRSTSDHVKTPYTLRFPRVLKIREDKPANECLSMNELLELTAQNKSVIKLNKRHIELSEIGNKKAKSSNKRAKLEIVNKMAYSGVIGDFLSGKKFYVQSGTNDWPVEDICNSIKKAGGVVVYKLNAEIDVVLVANVDEKVLVLMRKVNSFDIVMVDWLKKVLRDRRLVGYGLNDLVSSGVSFKRDLGDELDCFGDSFVEEIDVNGVRRVLDLMVKRGDFLNVNGSVIVD